MTPPTPAHILLLRVYCTEESDQAKRVTFRAETRAEKAASKAAFFVSETRASLTDEYAMVSNRVTMTRLEVQTEKIVVLRFPHRKH